MFHTIFMTNSITSVLGDSHHTSFMPKTFKISIDTVPNNTVSNENSWTPILFISGGTVGLLYFVYSKCNYSSAYNVIRWYTTISHKWNTITNASLNSIKNGHDVLSTYTEKIGCYFTEKDRLPWWLVSKGTRELREQQNHDEYTQYIQQFPWLFIYKSNNYYHTKEYEELKSLENEIESIQPDIYFILYRTLHKNDHLIYRRFNSYNEATQWYARFSTTHEANQSLREMHTDKSPFIQLTPRETNDIDWKTKLKPFHIKGNIVLDYPFIEWQLQEYSDNAKNIHTHYPIEYIDSMANMGTIEQHQHYEIK